MSDFSCLGVNEDAINLHLYPYTLSDAALECLDAEPHGSIIIWEELIKRFCNKFFSPTQEANIFLKIQAFQERDEESYRKAWNGFKELIRKCPHHGITIDNQVQYFYIELSPLSKSHVDSFDGGSVVNQFNNAYTCSS